VKPKSALLTQLRFDGEKMLYFFVFVLVQQKGLDGRRAGQVAGRG